MTLFDSQNRRDIYALELSGARKAVPFVQTPSDENVAEFSPDGRWVVYSSSETGRYEIYVKPFPSGGGRWQISADGGGEARWASSGKEIIFKLTSRFFSVPVETGATFRAGAPRLLFETGRPTFNATSGSSFTLSRDGKRILLAFPVKQEAARGDVVVVTNWAEEVLRATGQKPR